MFYDASRCGEVGEKKAKLLYATVHHFGPRWASNGALIMQSRSAPPDRELQELRSFIERENPTLEAIETFTPPASQR